MHITIIQLKIVIWWRNQWRCKTRQNYGFSLLFSNQNISAVKIRNVLDDTTKIRDLPWTGYIGTFQSAAIIWGQSAGDFQVERLSRYRSTREGWTTKPWNATSAFSPLLFAPSTAYRGNPSFSVSPSCSRPQ